MLVFRVFPYVPSALVGDSGHPDYLYPHQGNGRLDNPRHYLCRYLAVEASAAVGEKFANFASWHPAMFDQDRIVPGAVAAIGTYTIPDTVPLLDLDDAQSLVDRALRPTQVVARNRPVSQAWALKIFEEVRHDGSRKWSGIRWWSSHNPMWRVIGAWDVIPMLQKVEVLSVDHPAVIDAADALGRPLIT